MSKIIIAIFDIFDIMLYNEPKEGTSDSLEQKLNRHRLPD